MHVLEQERYRWTVGGGRNDLAIENAGAGETGPVLVLRALKSRGNVYRIDGGMAELDEMLEDGMFEIGDARSETIREIFVGRIEPGNVGERRPVPDRYLDVRRRVLQPVHGRLRTEIAAAIRRPAEGQIERGIAPRTCVIRIVLW